MKKYIISIIITAFFTFPLLAQLEAPVITFPSPEAASLGIYGAVPVNLSTGIPDISIPLYEFNLRKLTVPISLRYHLASVKPNIHPSWVGLGWNLSAGGCITRTVNGFPDEFMNTKGRKTGYLNHYNDLNSTDWYSDSKIGTYSANYISDAPHEVMPDEFTFNFCGYSGSFNLDHTGRWRVCSDTNIKVVFNEETDCIGSRELRSNLQHGIGKYYAGAVNKRFINQFTLITPDGTKYKFGGIDATEYTINYFQQNTGYLIATSWFLSEIISPEGDKITFNYEPGDPICEIKPFYTYIRKNGTFICGSLNRNQEAGRDGRLILPVYLKRISADNRYVEFNSQIRYDMRIRDTWSKLQVNKNPLFEARNIYYLQEEFDPLVNRYVFMSSPDDLKWRKLNQIKIVDGTIEKGYTFEYDENAQQRLKLKRLVEDMLQGEGIIRRIGIHKFNYYHKAENKWPGYFTDQEDHWGFFNKAGEYENGISDRLSYEIHRAPSSQLDVRLEEVLSQIIYPTGLRTNFIYENNDYSQHINSDNQLINNKSTSITGGVRIKRIIKYDPLTQTGSRKDFYYCNILKDTLNESSGILAKVPSYIYSFNYTYNKDSKDDKDTNSMEVFSSGAIGPYLYNINGSHIGYSHVIEVQKDLFGTIQGYKKYSFSNFEYDNITKENHMDEPPLYFLFTDNRLAQYSQKMQERGKKIYEEFYSANGKRLKTISYFYDRVATGNEIRLTNVTVLPLDDVNRLYNWNAYKKFTYSYFVTQRNEFSYENNHPYPIVTNTLFTYDGFRQITKFTSTHANYKEKIVEYIYPQNLVYATLYREMVQNNIVSVPITKRVTLQTLGAKTSTFLQKESFTYNKQGSLFYIQNYQIARKNELNPITQYRCEKIDKKGNPVSVFMREELEYVYLWSYKHNYPVAEIKNASYKKVAQLLGGEDALEDIGSKENFIYLLSSLARQLPMAQITIYNYSNDSQPLEIINPQGIHIKYEYYPSGELMQILDNNSYILKHFDYGYDIKS